MTIKHAHGVVHGKTIELDEELGLPDGQEVELQVTVVTKPKPSSEGILRSAEGWADHPEIDAVIDQTRQDRKLDRRTQGSGGVTGST
ncbi:hypothetical protein ACYOEI_37355 [Singulisphaera rosea]